MKVLPQNYSCEFVFDCSGRTFDANCGIIGLRADGEIAPPYELCTGYDDPLRVGVDPEPGQPFDGLTPEECAELADFMVGQWLAFKAARGPK